MEITKSNIFDQNLLNELGVVDWGYSENPESTTYDEYSKWVDLGLHGPLSYLSDERKLKRKNLKEVYPEFQSALVFLFTYKESKKKLLSSPLKRLMASYAYAFGGEDYHHVLKIKLDEIVKSLKDNGESFNYTHVIDTKPVLERDLAARAGLGWIGKNSMLISRAHGSYFLIATILLDKKLSIKSREIETDHCGTCTKCIDACPTNSILDNRMLDASKCISTFTIEIFKDTPAPSGFKSSEYFFGCDICQDVCPWNKKPLLESELLETATEKQNFFHDFFLTQDKAKLLEKLNQMSNREYQRIFKGTSLERTGRVGLIKNLKQL